MTLTIASDLVLVSTDEMARVFDYDPLIADILRIAASQKFETQEFLITLIAKACARHSEISAITLCLRKTPVMAESGSLGVRLTVTEADLATLR